MYSLNAPIPGRVATLASELFPALTAFDSIRDRHSLLVKRLPADEGFAPVAERTRRALRGAPAVEARVRGIDYFAEPTRGPGPVVYLAVESPGLQGIHDRLVDEHGAIEGLEGDDYTMHVTLARGGDLADARRLAERDVAPVTWTVSELEFWDATREEVIRTVRLPA